MNRRGTLLLQLALAALLAGSAFGAETAAPGKGTPALNPAPVFAQHSSATKGSAPGAASLKVGYVDLARVAQESETGKAARAELQGKSNKLRAKLEAKQSQLEKQKKAIEAKLPTYTPQQREAKGKEFQKKVEEFQKFARSAEQEMLGAEEKAKENVLQLIKEVATDYGQNNGFAVVVSKDQILYLNDSVATEDLTDKITRALDAKKKAK